jgi:anthranilate 1,2-dioxygenase large subunit
MLKNQHRIALRWPAKRNELPREIFHRADIYQLELERIFNGPHWFPVAHLAEIPKQGDYKTTWIGEVPILVVHGDDDRLRVFLNACPHRSTQLKTCNRGHAAEIECPYHRWLFTIRGDLISAPAMDQFPPDFRKEKFGLTAVRSSEIHGLVFATLSDETPELDVFLGLAKDYFVKVLGNGKLKLLGYQKALLNANWKEVADNDGYHAPLLHKAFRLLNWQSGKGTQKVTEYGHKALEAHLQPIGNTGFLADNSVVEYRDTGVPLRSIVISLFPDNSVIKHLDVINIRYKFPRSLDTTEVNYAYFGHEEDDAEMLRHRVRQASNLLGPSGLVTLEDSAVFNRRHVGAHSPGVETLQKNVNIPLEPPCVLTQSGENENIPRWDHYRQCMGFERG